MTDNDTTGTDEPAIGSTQQGKGEGGGGASQQGGAGTSPTTPQSGGTASGTSPLATAPAAPPYQPPFADQLKQYMYPSLTIYPDTDVTPLITGAAYFPAVLNAINSLSGDVSKQFIYITGWWLSGTFSLSGKGASPTLAELLAAKSKAGVDVRVLGGVMAPSINDVVVKHAADFGMWKQTMWFIDTLRKIEPTMGDKAVLNTLAHPAGAIHLKMAVIGSDAGATGFVGGMDFEYQRHGSDWHDVAIAVKGSVTQTLINAFADMWNEIQARPAVTLKIPPDPPAHGLPPTVSTMVNRTGGMAKLTAPAVAGSSGKTLRAQSLRTLPQFNIVSGLPSNDPLSYATGGVVDVAHAWKKAILAAKDYIYVEDQSFSSAEIFDWLNKAFKAAPKLRIILVTGKVDPNDKDDSRQYYFYNFLNDHLLDGLLGKDTSYYDLHYRIAVYSHTGKIVHSKTTIIDDRWAIIGSANFMRRSLYTDFEQSVSFMDDQGVAVPAYRTDLWSRHLSASIPDMQKGIRAWFGSSAPPSMVRLPLPLPASWAGPIDMVKYNNYRDVDARDPWPPNPTLLDWMN